jgi:hypothetical protein
VPAHSRTALAEPPSVEERFPDLTAEIAAIVSDAIDETIAEYGLEGLVTEGDALVNAALNYAMQRAAELVTQIDETTRDELQTMIEDAVKENLSPAELADRIGESFAFSDARADLIAQTELTDAWNTGLGQTLKDAGEDYVFVNEPGPAEDEECADIKADGGQIWTIDEFLADPSGHPLCEREGRALTPEEVDEMAAEEAAGSEGDIP